MFYWQSHCCWPQVTFEGSSSVFVPGVSDGGLMHPRNIVYQVPLLFPFISFSLLVQLLLPAATVQKLQKSDAILIYVTISFPVEWLRDGIVCHRILSIQAVWTVSKMPWTRSGKQRWASLRTSRSARTYWPHLLIAGVTAPGMLPGMLSQLWGQRDTVCSVQLATAFWQNQDYKPNQCCCLLAVRFQWDPTRTATPLQFTWNINNQGWTLCSVKLRWLLYLRFGLLSPFVLYCQVVQNHHFAVIRQLICSLHVCLHLPHQIINK